MRLLELRAKGSSLALIPGRCRLAVARDLVAAMLGTGLVARDTMPLQSVYTQSYLPIIG